MYIKDSALPTSRATTIGYHGCRCRRAGKVKRPGSVPMQRNHGRCSRTVRVRSSIHRCLQRMECQRRMTYQPACNVGNGVGFRGGMTVPPAMHCYLYNSAFLRSASDGAYNTVIVTAGQSNAPRHRAYGGMAQLARLRPVPHVSESGTAFWQACRRRLVEPARHDQYNVNGGGWQ